MVLVPQIKHAALADLNHDQTAFARIVQSMTECMLGVVAVVHDALKGRSFSLLLTLLAAVFRASAGGIVLMVTGAITLHGQAPRQFAQTFFLANQKQHDKHNFYVLNDNFRLLDTIPSVLQVSSL